MTEKNEFGEVWEHITDQHFIDEIRECFKPFKDNRFWLDDMVLVKENEIGENLSENFYKRRYVLDVHAGKNGNGDWNEYLTNMNNIFYNLKKLFEKVYLLDWKNDCADDVSYARIIVGNYRERN